MIRKKCREKGHRVAEIEGVMLPVIFCRRWFCDGSTVADWVTGPIRQALQAVCDKENNQ